MSVLGDTFVMININYFYGQTIIVVVAILIHGCDQLISTPTISMFRHAARQ